MRTTLRVLVGVAFLISVAPASVDAQPAEGAQPTAGAEATKGTAVAPGTQGKPAPAAKAPAAEAPAATAKKVANPEPPPAAPAKPMSPELTAIVDGVTAFYEKVAHMKTKFRQVVSQKTMARTRKASGVIEFLKPGKMRWEYAKPEKLLYVSDGTTLWTYQPEDALVYKARIKGSRAYHALRFLFGLGDLREAFDIEMGPAHSPGTAYLILTPRDGKQDYDNLALVVDRKTHEIRESFLTDAVGNVTHYIFDGPDYEVDVPETRFQFTPPAGATVQEL